MLLLSEDFNTATGEKLSYLRHSLIPWCSGGQNTHQSWSHHEVQDWMSVPPYQSVNACVSQAFLAEMRSSGVSTQEDRCQMLVAKHTKAGKKEL